MKYLKAIILFSILSVYSLKAQDLQKISVRVVNDAGQTIKNAKVAAILKSGAYQDALFDVASGEYRCQPTEKCIKVFAGAFGHEASSVRFPGVGGVFSLTLKKSPLKHSTVIHRSGSLPGIVGYVNPILDNLKRTYIYATKIGLESKGKPAMQPLYFSLNKPIDAVSQTGNSFKIWVVDITQEVSVVEYTLPK